MKYNTIVILGLASALCSCSSVSKVSSTALKAGAAPLSSFVEHPKQMKPQRERSPFALVWVNPSLPTRRAQYNTIYIAPVNTSHLRAASKTLIEKTTGLDHKERPVHEFADLMKRSFEDTFLHSPAPRLKLAPAPMTGGVTLSLALVELNPTDTKGNALKTAIPYGGALSPLMNGNIAIEGQVRDNMTGELLFEFADNERDQMTVVSLRDYSPWEHAKASIRDWAKQFEELTRTPPTHKVKDSLFFTLNLR